MIGLLLFILSCVLIDKNPVIITPKMEIDTYRAALYSMEIDFSKVQQVVPEIQYTIPGLSSVSYKYIIQYGRDTGIEILDPGNEIKAFTGCIRKFDYSKNESTFTCFMDHGRTYYTSNDSITYSIEVSKGSVTNLCKEIELNSRCDSVSFISHSTKTDYTVIFKETITNIPSNSLFYPDIEFLPYKIIGVGLSKNTMTMEGVMYGKSSIDSLLQLYSYEGYEQITDKDITPADRQFVIELIEKLKRVD